MPAPLYQTLHPGTRWLITLVVMSATLMQVIDTTIVNVALPHMQGSLGASSDGITWTLTCYMVASAIFMPLTGFLSERFGRKEYLLISIAGFTVTSALCGASTTLAEIIFFRLLQGIFGASLVPLSQAILADIFPPEDRGKAMAIWGVGVMVGPILGPTLGGYLTEYASWRWTFYVNVPVGIVTLLLANVIPYTPRKERMMDWLGLFLISISIGGLQYVLDRGNHDDWFAAGSICLITYLSLASFLGFVLHNLSNAKTFVFDLKIFKDKNFALASLLLCIFGLGLYGMMVVQPLMMEGLLNYPAMTTGLMMAPRGISGMVSMMVVSKLINRVDPRLLVFAGIMICIFGLVITTHYSLTSISPLWLMGPMILQGFGLGMVFVPLATIAYSTLATHLRTEAAGLYSLVRTIGGSIGISVTITLYTRHSQQFWNQLGGFIHPFNTALYQYLAPLHLAPNSAVAAALLGGEVSKQAAMVSFINVFTFIMWCFVLMMPLILLLEKGKLSGSASHKLIEDH